MKYAHENGCPWDTDHILDVLYDQCYSEQVDTQAYVEAMESLDMARARGRMRRMRYRERMRQSVRNVQALLDQNKQKLPEGDYLTATNSMLDIYKLTKKADDEEDYDT